MMQQVQPTSDGESCIWDSFAARRKCLRIFSTKGEDKSRCTRLDGLVLPQPKRRRSTKHAIFCGAAGAGRSDGIREMRWV